MPNQQDPFLLVKEEIQDSLVKAQTEFESWQRAKSANDHAQLASSIEDECKSIAWQVEELSKAVDVAERNVARFNLTQADIAMRRKWIMQTTREVERLTEGLKAPAKAAPPSPRRKLNHAIHEENERFINNTSDQQLQMVRQQDDQLDSMGDSIQRIGHIGLTIHEELSQQSTMLDELDEDVEGTSARLHAAQKRINHVLAKAGMKGQMLIVLFLIIVLAVLIVVAFS